jgi:hypothetical protein
MNSDKITRKRKKKKGGGGGLGLRTVRNVEPNRGDGCRGRERHRTAETRQAEDETQRAHEPDWHEDKRESLSAPAIPDAGVKL